jgi:hypothetical protein
MEFCCFGENLTISPPRAIVLDSIIKYGEITRQLYLTYISTYSIPVLNTLTQLDRELGITPKCYPIYAMTPYLKCMVISINVPTPICFPSSQSGPEQGQAPAALL